MKHKINKVLSILLALALVMSLAPVVSQTARAAQAQDPIKYLDETGAEKECTSYTVIDGSTTAWTGQTTGGWYVLSSSVEISERIEVTGSVHLILVDNCTLTASQGIQVEGENSLTIYGQSKGTAAGTLNATGRDGDAAIGGAGGSGGRDFWDDDRGGDGGAACAGGAVFRKKSPDERSQSK